MEHECMIYSNNPEPDYMALYFDRDGQEIFREEFHLNDRTKDFELKYARVCEKIQAIVRSFGRSWIPTAISAENSAPVNGSRPGSCRAYNKSEIGNRK